MLNNRSRNFRKDINGLRAWAVVCVIFFHFNMGLFKGGFVGVDVFFVISGFLMTGIITSNLDQGQENPFSLIQFYLARARRIIPALLGLCLVLLILGWFYMPPSDYRTLSAHIVSAVCFFSNVKFWKEAGYFDAASHEKWLLHSWTLSVEWQFYILLPIVLMLLWKIRSSKQFISACMIAGFCFSLFLSLFLTPIATSAAFYLLPTRAWEMLAGGLVYLHAGRLRPTGWHAKLIETTGFLMVLLAVVFFNSSNSWPGYLALLPVSGAVFILLADRQNSTWTQTPIAQWLGNCSYSLYLWHWPIVVALFYWGLQPSFVNILFGIAATLALGSASYYLIEKPSRSFLSKRKINYAIYSILSSILLITIPSLSVIIFKGFDKRSTEWIEELDGKYSEHIIRNNCIEKMIVGNIKDCHVGVSKEQIDGVMFGDSYNNAYAGFINELAKDAGLMIHDSSRSFTPFIPNIYVENVNDKVDKKTANSIINYNNERFAFAKNSKIVIFSNFWDQYNDNNKLFRVIDNNNNDISNETENLIFNTIHEMLKLKINVVILARPFSVVGSNEILKLKNSKLKRKDINKYKYDYGNDKNNRIEYRIKKTFPQVILIDPNDVICTKSDNGNTTTCNASIDGKILFMNDGAHLNHIGASLLGKEYLKIKGNPLKGLDN